MRAAVRSGRLVRRRRHPVRSVDRDASRSTGRVTDMLCAQAHNRSAASGGCRARCSAGPERTSAWDCCAAIPSSACRVPPRFVAPLETRQPRHWTPRRRRSATRRSSAATAQLQALNEAFASRESRRRGGGIRLGPRASARARWSAASSARSPAPRRRRRARRALLRERVGAVQGARRRGRRSEPPPRIDCRAHDVESLLPPDVSALTRVFPVLLQVHAIADVPRDQQLEPSPIRSRLRRRAFDALRELLGRVAIAGRWSSASTTCSGPTPTASCCSRSCFGRRARPPCSRCCPSGARRRPPSRFCERCSSAPAATSGRRFRSSR